MSINRPKPLFKVASEFNVTTQTIVDALSDDFEVANRPNFKITPEMYSALEGIYGDNKAKSQDQDRSREDYESRRNSMMNQRNESVTLDSLEPIDETAGLEPEDEPTESPEETLEPAEETTELEPEEESEKEEEKPEEISEPEPEVEEVEANVKVEDDEDDEEEASEDEEETETAYEDEANEEGE